MVVDGRGTTAPTPITPAGRDNGRSPPPGRSQRPSPKGSPLFYTGRARPTTRRSARRRCRSAGGLWAGSIVPDRRSWTTMSGCHGRRLNLLRRDAGAGEGAAGRFDPARPWPARRSRRLPARRCGGGDRSGGQLSVLGGRRRIDRPVGRRSGGNDARRRRPARIRRGRGTGRSGIARLAQRHRRGRRPVTCSSPMPAIAGWREVPAHSGVSFGRSVKAGTSSPWPAVPAATMPTHLPPPWPSTRPATCSSPTRRPTGSACSARKSGPCSADRLTAGRPVTVAGTGTPGFSGDGGRADRSRARRPERCGRRPRGRPAHRAIRPTAGSAWWPPRPGPAMASPCTPGEIYTVAGTGTSGSAGDGGPARLAEIWDPGAMTVDRHRQRLHRRPGQPHRPGALARGDQPSRDHRGRRRSRHRGRRGLLRPLSRSTGSRPSGRPASSTSRPAWPSTPPATSTFADGDMHVIRGHRRSAPAAAGQGHRPRRPVHRGRRLSGWGPPAHQTSGS